MTAETAFPVTGRKIRKNQDGLFEVRMIQVEITDPKDIQSVQFISQSGEDSSPPDGSAVIILTIGTTKFAIAAEDNILPAALPGEKLLYSSAGGAKQAEISLRTNGDIELNGNTDFAVRLDALQIIMNTLATALDTEFAAIDTAVPAYSFVTPITIDLTTAKVTTVKLP